MASAGTVSSGYRGTWNVSRGNQVIIMKTRFKFPKILQICEVEAHIYFGVNNFFLKRAGVKALPSFQLIKEKRTRVQEYQIQITTTFRASNHPNAWPRQGPKVLPRP
jgi:hypothetical protein